MSPKILLINYSKADAAWIEKNTGLKVIRGYMSEVEGYIVEHDGTKEPNIKFYSPEAYYECAMTFINIPASEDLKIEFDEKARMLNKDDITNMLSYWQAKGQVLAFFVGDTNIKSLWPLGVPQNFQSSSGNDTRTSLNVEDDHSLYPLLSMLERQIKMPTQKYVVSGLKPKKDQYSPEPYYSFGTKWYSYVSNANGDRLLTALSKGNDDYHGEVPGVLIIPQPKKLPTTTTKVIEFFGEYYGIYTPNSDWQSSDIFYPQAKLKELTKQIADIRADAEAQSLAKQSLIEDHLNEWNFLKDLVTQQGDPLVNAVYKVLGTVLGVNVTKSDENLEGAEPIEDLIVELNDRTISIEVKGTTKSNPPLEYTQQPFQHILRRGYDKEVEAGLILNHDMNKDPQVRHNAYTDKDKEALLTNLHFIDTRVLLSISIAVIDGQISKEEAIETLFGKKGRVEYTKEG